MRSNLISIATVALFLQASPGIANPGGEPNSFQIDTLSARPHLASGGDVLVRVGAPKQVALGTVRVTLNGADVTAAFRADAASHSLTGLVSGLMLGENSLQASAPKGAGKGGPTKKLKVTNYPITGPMISGPHQYPFACRTEAFVPFPGSPTLGVPTDSNCSVPTRVQYVYRTTSNTFASLPEPHSMLPSNLATTTTVTGATVPYIVRLETGTINRAIYQTAILHNPNDPAPSPFSPPAGWNKRLVYPLGGGCIAGWYTQGQSIVNPLNDLYLGQGYGVAVATLTTFGNNCNDLLSSETIMMVKERFIESYGVPLFTIGTGSSGGAYQSNQTGDNYPGVFDGIVTMSSFPDVTSGMFPMHSSRLLELYFAARPGRYTVDQQKAISGYLSIPGQILHMSRVRGNRMDPRVAFPPQIVAGVGPEFRYDPVTNPYGARGDVYDHTVNVYGYVPDTPFPGDARFAQRPLDNVGVQYGLRALNNGDISVEDFLDMNAAIGGVDIDFNHVPNRTAFYPGATRRAYQGGRILYGGNGLAGMPIITRMGGGDLAVNGDVHLRYHAHSIRARLMKANGHADNQVIVGNQAPTDVLIEQMGRWLAAIAVDSSKRSLAQKVVANKPADVVDACWSGGVKIVEPQTLDGPGQCNQLFPVGVPPEFVAGAPIQLDTVKCQLKPIDMSDYAVPFSPEQRNQLHAIFPDGVCDWSKPGVEQVPGVPWASFGPSPVNQVFDVLNP